MPGIDDATGSSQSQSLTPLYADEDFDYPVVEELRRLGYDVLTVPEAGQAGQPDPAVLAYAVGQGRAVLTHNRRHFIRLHRQSPFHCGIIVCTRDKTPPLWPGAFIKLSLASRIWTIS
jgi:hypothetical protein